MFILQTKAVHIITFSKLDSYSSPLFKSLGLIQFFYAALFQIAIIVMYKFYNNMLPAAFHSFLTKVTSVYNYYYNTTFAAKHSYYLPYARNKLIMANLIISVFKVNLSGLPWMIMSYYHPLYQSSNID